MSVAPARPWDRRLVLLAWLLAIAASVSVALVGALVDEAWRAQDPTGDSFLTFTASIGLLAGTYATVGTLILLRQRNPIGASMVAGATCIAIAFTGYAVAGLRFAVAGELDPLGGLATVVGEAVGVPGLFFAFSLVAIVFPDGRPPTPRWRLPVGLLLASVVASAVIAIVAPRPPEVGLAPNPLAIPGLSVELARLGSVIGGVGLVVGALVAPLALAVRFRRAGEVERAQVKWLLLATALFAPVFAVSWVTEEPSLDVLGIAIALTIPLSIAVAVMRYRLFEIDRLISRTLTYGLLTGSLVTLFAVLAVALQTALVGLTDRTGLPVAISTLVVAATFQPLRGRIQRFVDRRFDRARYDGERTADRFADRLRHELDLDALERELTGTVTAVLRPEAAAMWLRGARRDVS